MTDLVIKGQFNKEVYVRIYQICLSLTDKHLYFEIQLKDSKDISYKHVIYKLNCLLSSIILSYGYITVTEFQFCFFKGINLKAVLKIITFKVYGLFIGQYRNTRKYHKYEIIYLSA